MRPCCGWGGLSGSAQDAVGCGDALAWSGSTAGAAWQTRHGAAEGAVGAVRHEPAALAAGGIVGRTRASLSPAEQSGTEHRPNGDAFWRGSLPFLLPKGPALCCWHAVGCRGPRFGSLEVSFCVPAPWLSRWHGAGLGAGVAEGWESLAEFGRWRDGGGCRLSPGSELCLPDFFLAPRRSWRTQKVCSEQLGTRSSWGSPLRRGTGRHKPLPVAPWHLFQAPCRRLRRPCCWGRRALSTWGELPAGAAPDPRRQDPPWAPCAPSPGAAESMRPPTAPRTESPAFHALV